MSGWEQVEIRDRGDAPPIAASIRSGVGEPVLCLHGIQGRRQVFEPLADAPGLVDNMLVAIDFPGFGESAPRMRRGDHLQAFADDVRGVARELGVDRFHLVGHSLGGMVGTLLLAGSSPVLSLANLEGNLTFSDCGASLTATTMSLEAFQERGFDTLITEIAASADPSVQERLLALRQTTALTFYQTAQSIVEWSKNPRLLDLFVSSRVPRCLVVGELNEHKTDVLPDFVPRYTIGEAGHFMLLENPTATINALSDWMATLTPGRRLQD
jgi:pimeloyl-ACP methyl ester carboxylesterase